MSTREASVEGSRRSGRNSASQPTPAPSPHRIKTLHEVGLPYVVHATSLSSWLTIRYEGLRPMGREHIHVCAGMPGSSDNIPEDAQVAIWVDLKRAVQAGIPFYLSANQVILSPGDNGLVSIEYFEQVKDLGSGQVLWTPRSGHRDAAFGMLTSAAVTDPPTPMPQRPPPL
eukprot:gnl/TRDRNA2_/TRDRNA2_168336_c1_seq5.p1 gnl/TRDRNA2_/TRDRNA2_168336_c1~~gnl/TRDRNA2_/TRDRNA2_168336_c1_seq5.p1  ORF type:complete len:171 (+),score=23.49 gnl/TRDRNA2_/TRDRNA2_168336_c1_seq5:77-589(+)